MKLRNRILSFFLIAVLVIGLLVGSAFALDVPTSLTPIENVMGNFTGLMDWTEETLSDHPDAIICVLMDYRASYTRCVVYAFASDTHLYVDLSQKKYASEQGATMYGCRVATSYNYAGNDDFPSGYPDASHGTLVLHDINFIWWGFNYAAQSSENVTYYCSNSFWTNTNSVIGHSRNLDLESVLPDIRSLFFQRTLLNNDEFMQITVSDVTDYLNSYVYIEYVQDDSTNGYVIYPESYFRGRLVYAEQNPSDPDAVPDYFTFYVTPVLISAYEYEVVHVTYYSQSYGSKQINTSVVFNGNTGIPPADDYDYFYYFNEFFDNENLTGYFGWIWQNVHIYQEGESPNLHWVCWDDDLSLNKDYLLNILFLPDWFTRLEDWTQGIDFSSIFESYDVVLMDCSEDIFDAVYYSGFYDDLYQEYVAQQLEGTSHANNVVISYILSNSSDITNLRPYMTPDSTYSDAMGCLFTRTYYMKALLSGLGDTNDRLLEFETALCAEDGILYGIQKKMMDSYEQDNGFYNEVLSWFRKWNSALEQINRLNWFQSVHDYLKGIYESLVHGVGDSIDFNTLESPLIYIYRFFNGMYDTAKDYSGNMIGLFTSVSNGYYIDSPTATPIPLLPSDWSAPSIDGGSSLGDITPISEPVPTLIPVY